MKSVRNKKIKPGQQNKGWLVDFKHTNFFYFALKKTSYFILYYYHKIADPYLYWDDLLSILVDDDRFCSDVISEPGVGYLGRTRLRFPHHGIADQDDFPSIHILYCHHCA